MKKTIFITYSLFISLVLNAQNTKFEYLLSSQETIDDSLIVIYDYLSNFSNEGEFEEKRLDIKKIEFSLIGVDNDTLNALFYEKYAALLRRGGDLNKAIENYNKAENLYLKSKKYKELSAVYFNHSKALTSNFEFEEAINLCEQSLEIAQNIEDKSAQARAFIQIGINYDYQDEFDKAIEFYIQALDIYLELDDKQGLSNAFNNLGVMYDLKGDLNLAMDYYQKSLRIEQELNNKQGVAGSLINIALINQLNEDWKTAEENFRNSLKLYEEIGDDFGLGICYVNFADFYKEKGDYDLAIRYAQKSIELTQSTGDVRQLMENYEKLISIYDVSDKYEIALKMQSELMELKDSIYNSVKNNRMESVQSQLQSVDDENTKLKIENENLSKEKTYLLSLNQRIIIVSLFLLLLFLAYTIYLKLNK